MGVSMRTPINNWKKITSVLLGWFAQQNVHREARLTIQINVFVRSLRAFRRFRFPPQVIGALGADLLAKQNQSGSQTCRASDLLIVVLSSICGANPSAFQHIPTMQEFFGLGTA